MALPMIKLGGVTYIQPSRATKFPAGRVTTHVPIDGDVITQRSNNRDSFGDKNIPREMSWEMIPDVATSYDWTGTPASLKALEGTEISFDPNSSFAGYSSALNIMVINVDLEWVGYNGTLNFYSATMTYTHH